MTKKYKTTTLHLNENSNLVLHAYDGSAYTSNHKRKDYDFIEYSNITDSYISGVAFFEGEWWPSEMNIGIWRKTELLINTPISCPLWSSYSGEDAGY